MLGFQRFEENFMKETESNKKKASMEDLGVTFLSLSQKMLVKNPMKEIEKRM